MLFRMSRMLGVMLMGLGLCSTTPISAQPAADPPPVSLADSLTGEAKTEYEAAKDLLEVEDVANALVKFQRAYELSKEYRLLWNVAVCERRLSHYRLAQSALVRYRAAGAGKFTPAELEKLEGLDKTLAKFISTIELEVNEPGATLFVDGEKVGALPLSEPLRVDVGKRVFRFEKPGFKTLTIERTLTGNSTEKIAAKLEKEVHEGKLRVEAGPKDAIVLDGKTVGLGHYEATLASGGHSLRVTAPGMIAFQTEVLIEDNKFRRLAVKLDPRPNQVDLTRAGWIGGGAALVVGGLIVGALMYKPASLAPVQGTWGTNELP